MTEPSIESAERSARAADRGVPAGVQAERDSDSPPGTPRWVKFFGIGLVVLLLLLAGLHLTGNAPTHGMPPTEPPRHGVQRP